MTSFRQRQSKTNLPTYEKYFNQNLNVLKMFLKEGVKQYF